MISSYRASIMESKVSSQEILPLVEKQVVMVSGQEDLCQRSKDIQHIEVHKNSNTQFHLDSEEHPCLKLTNGDKAGRIFFLILMLLIPIFGWIYLACKAKTIKQDRFIVISNSATGTNTHTNSDLGMTLLPFIYPWEKTNVISLSSNYRNINNIVRYMRVAPGHIRFAHTLSGKTHIYGQGVHLVKNPQIILGDTDHSLKSSEVIQHRNASIINIPPDKVATLSWGSQSIFLEGEQNYAIQTQIEPQIKTHLLNKSEIHLQDKMIINPPPGSVAILRLENQFQVLDPTKVKSGGPYYLKHTNLQVGGILPAPQTIQSAKIANISVRDLDSVDVIFSANFQYWIVDPLVLSRQLADFKAESLAIQRGKSINECQSLKNWEENLANTCFKQIKVLLSKPYPISCCANISKEQQQDIDAYIQQRAEEISACLKLYGCKLEEGSFNISTPDLADKEANDKFRENSIKLKKATAERTINIAKGKADIAKAKADGIAKVTQAKAEMEAQRQSALAQRAVAEAKAHVMQIQADSQAKATLTTGEAEAKVMASKSVAKTSGMLKAFLETCKVSGEEALNA